MDENGIIKNTVNIRDISSSLIFIFIWKENIKYGNV